MTRRNTSGMSCAGSYRTLRDGALEGRFSRHFVPGYDRVVPPGQDVLFSGRLEIRGPESQLERVVKCPGGRCDRSLARRHEVPEAEPPRKGRPVGCGVTVSRRFRKRSMTTRNTSGISSPDHTVPYGTVVWEGPFPALRAGLRSGCPSGTGCVVLREIGNPRS
jgi:hypothetical protein